ncbi:unnamed protein product [Caenorhabditis auriculariae]|uniref:Uncharacterized protein n=1 Tax=Caenorhabditis auriculariae TaxID=2777116 RepID=A0A8S1HEP0_9PELO|nr:unnamed protein product [Caenorhabditis auriculariae]
MHGSNVGDRDQSFFQDRIFIGGVNPKENLGSRQEKDGCDSRATATPEALTHIRIVLQPESQGRMPLVHQPISLFRLGVRPLRHSQLLLIPDVDDAV